MGLHINNLESDTEHLTQTGLRGVASGPGHTPNQPLYLWSQIIFPQNSLIRQYPYACVHVWQLYIYYVLLWWQPEGPQMSGL